MSFLCKGGFEARVVIKSCKNGFSYGIIDVITNVIHEGEGSHFKASHLCHGPVDSCKICYAFFANAQRFAIKWPCYSIDDKSGGVFTNHNCFIPVSDKHFDSVGSFNRSGHTRNDFYKWHQGSRIKKMNTQKAAWIFQTSPN